TALDSEDRQDAGFTGYLLIGQFNYLVVAIEWAADDPYVAGGVYEYSIVKPFKYVFPA
ncbi:YciI family protein, partial [Pseudoalteromonas sp. S1612]|uniref:YciI family protein n=1 Tax=Pseudoalteromonas sp. S1612 TaxID=579507 RepID=UPI00127C1622